jgi:hypothetical protein
MELEEDKLWNGFNWRDCGDEPFGFIHGVTFLVY